MHNDTNITVLGLGAVGRSLSIALHNSGYTIKSLLSRNENRKKELPSELHSLFSIYTGDGEAELGDIIFICVSDNAIRDVAVQLAETYNLNGKMLVHCSGNFTAEILQTAEVQNIKTAAFHPLKSFAGQPETNPFKGIYIDIEAQKPAVNILSGIARNLGAFPFEIKAAAKPFLHIASVIASNYVVTLLDIASETSEMGGIKRSEVQKALLALLRGTLQNIEKSGVEKALTGPLARGDTKTIQKHIQILEQNPDISDLYKKLGAKTVNIAERDKRISMKQAKQLREILNE